MQRALASVTGGAGLLMTGVVLAGRRPLATTTSTKMQSFYDIVEVCGPHSPTLSFHPLSPLPDMTSAIILLLVSDSLLQLTPSCCDPAATDDCCWGAPSLRPVQGKGCVRRQCCVRMVQIWLVPVIAALPLCILVVTKNHPIRPSQMHHSPPCPISLAHLSPPPFPTFTSLTSAVAATFTTN